MSLTEEPPEDDQPLKLLTWNINSFLQSIQDKTFGYNHFGSENKWYLCMHTIKRKGNFKGSYIYAYWSYTVIFQIDFFLISPHCTESHQHHKNNIYCLLNFSPSIIFHRNLALCQLDLIQLRNIHLITPVMYMAMHHIFCTTTNYSFKSYSFYSVAITIVTKIVTFRIFSCRDKI